MKNIELLYQNSLIPKDEIDSLKPLLVEELNQLILASKKGYEDDRASINLAFDQPNLTKIKHLINEKKKLNPKYLVLIGIGGSNLGTIAIQEAVLGKLYNQKNSEMKILYVDTVDTDQINDTISIIKQVLKNGDNIIVNIVSKSGGTTETIANFQVILDLLKKYKNDYWKYIVVTTDNNSKLWNLGEEKNFDLLEIPKRVGGRFSVFSAVGLFPLGLIGLNIDSLLDGAKNTCKDCLSSDLFSNQAMISASLIYLYFKKGVNIIDHFFFDTDFESVGKWYRQLMAESLGKQFNKNNEQVFTGPTPTFSIGSIDLHSVGQLYLGGPFDKLIYFIKIKNNKNKILIPNLSDYSQLVESIQGKSLDEIMSAILEGVKQAFINKKRPFLEISIEDKSEYSIASFLQFKMIEIMYLGHLLNVNTFNQPNVEDYKIETRKILKEKLERIH